jgi:hypothetical protein
MSKKLDRAMYGPSWIEVMVGAILSVTLGVVLAATFLIFKPVTQVKELPKEPAVGMVYYIEGSHDSAKAHRVVSKLKIFAQGGSIVLNEDEINTAATPPAPAAPATPPAKGAAAEVESGEFLTPGTPNFRIHDGQLQISVPVRVKYALVGLNQSFLVQAKGTIARQGDTFAYVPDTVYVGSCPLQRLPLATGWVIKKILGAQHVPADLAAAWGRLAEVTIEPTALKLTVAKP